MKSAAVIIGTTALGVALGIMLQPWLSGLVNRAKSPATSS